MSQLEQCLTLLRGPDDEKRFVGMVLITRILKPAADGGQVDEASVMQVERPVTIRTHEHEALNHRQVAEALGDDFLDRLLATPGEYALLALHVLRVFCEVQALAAATRMVTRAPQMAQLLDTVTQSGGSTGAQEGSTCAADALACLSGISAARGEGSAQAVETTLLQVCSALEGVAEQTWEV